MANERLYEDMEPREKFEALWLKAGLHKRPGADALLYELEKQGLFDLPASIKHHSNRFGGLVSNPHRQCCGCGNGTVRNKPRL